MREIQSQNLRAGDTLCFVHPNNSVDRHVVDLVIEREPEPGRENVQVHCNNQTMTFSFFSDEPVLVE